jgi:error-prone DNA polymerase
MVERLMQARLTRTFSDLEDFRLRVRPSRDEFEVLAESGALERLQAGRRKALWATRRPEPGPLFRRIDSAPRDTRAKAIDLPPVGRGAHLRFDYDTKGLCLNDHPLLHLRQWLRTKQVVTANTLPRCERGDRVAVAGLVLCRQQPFTASGILFVTLEDETGTVNLIVRQHVQARYGLLLHQASLLLARGRLERTEPRQGAGARNEADWVPVIHLLAEEFEQLDRGNRALGGFSRNFH